MWNTLRQVLSPFPPVCLTAIGEEATVFAPPTVSDDLLQRAGISANLLPCLPRVTVALHHPAIPPIVVGSPLLPALESDHVKSFPPEWFGRLFGEMAEQARHLRASPALVSEPLSAPSLDDFFGPAEDEEGVCAVTRPAGRTDTVPTAGPRRRDFLHDELADELAHFRGLASLKRVFWELLAYERIDEPVPEGFIPRTVASALLSARLFACHEGLHILLVQVRDGHFLRTVRRAVLERAATRLPHGAVLLFCDYAWQRVALGFAVAGEGGNRAFLRLAPVPEDVDGLARLLGQVRTHTREDIHRPLIELIQAYQRLCGADAEGAEDRAAFSEHPVDPVLLHIRDLARYPTLSASETLDLLRQVADISPEERRSTRRVEYERCRNRLIMGHLRLCHFVIKKHRLRPRCRSMYWTDLMQEGVFGLGKAIDRFDLQRGCRFSTYAVHWIRAAITSAIANKDRLVRVPRSVAERRAEIAAEARRWVSHLLSLSAVEPRARSDLPAQNTCPLEGALSAEQPEWVHRALRALEYREREIIMLRFGLRDGLTYTLEECGRIFGVTKERVRQIQKKAIKKLQFLVPG